MSKTVVRPLSRAQILARARDLLTHGNWDDMGHSEYDAAWIARIPKPGTREPAFPEFVKEVRRGQDAKDGGWAPTVDYMSARILATLASILAVIEFDNGPEARRRAERGAAFVRGNWHRLKQEPDLTIGFELVAASLIEECCERGFDLHALRAETSALRDEKLSKVPEKLKYSPTFNLGYTIEFMGGAVDKEKAVALLAPNGSMSGSVASTAYFARQGNETAFRFCQQMAKEWGPKRTPCNMPSKLWTAIWLLYHFELAGLFPELRAELAPHLDFVSKQVGPHGLGWSTEVLYGDSDDTAVGLMLLHDTGYEVNWSLLNQYERPHGFVGFLAERGPSVSANAHVLEAILGRPHPGGAATADKVARFLLERRIEGAYWTDKWHASPYYVTSHAVLPLLRWDAASVQPSVRWLQETQRPDGGWGWFNRSSAEETAYALYALAICHLKGLPVDPAVLEGGLSFLEQYDGTESDALHPHLWIGKGLYRPLLVIRASVLTAQILAMKALGLEGQSEGPTQRTA